MSTDSTPSTGRMSDIEAQLVSQAMQDAAFRDRLLANPKAVLAEQGLAIPENVQIQVLQETPNQYYLVLPVATEATSASTPALSDTELETISGGMPTYGGTSQEIKSTGNASWTGCGSGQSGCVVP